MTIRKGKQEPVTHTAKPNHMKERECNELTVVDDFRDDAINY